MYTNYTNIPLVLAVWLAANDGYDLKPEEDIISATSLMKPTKSLILGKRLAAQNIEGDIDISDLIPARLGTAVHSAVETSWIYSREKGMTQLGIPLPVINKIVLNPDTPSEDPRFDVYAEQRSIKQVGKWRISGKFDFVYEGRVNDVKTTKVFNWIKGSNDKKYMIQGSIYRWLNQDIITDNFVNVLMIFTDWTPLKARMDKEYPQSQVKVRILELMSIPETERWIKTRLTEIEEAWDAKQVDMPLCTPEEIWMAPAKYAYYKTATLKRATKLYDTPEEANARKATDNLPNSRIIHRQSEPKFCNYCEARQICMQAEQYITEGILTL